MGNQLPTLIQSETNDRFKLWKSLLTSKGIKKEGTAILSGKKLIQEYLLKYSNQIVAELRLEKQPAVSLAPQFILSANIFSELDELGTHFNLLVIKTPELPKWKDDLKSGMVLFLPLGDPSNLGAAIRSAHSFQVDQIVLLQESANTYLPKTIKSSAGSVFSAPLYIGPTLSQLPMEVIALDQSGKSLPDFQWPKLSYLVVGEEGPGLKGLQIQKKVTIPIENVESLNATVATSIALYDWKIKNKK